MEIAFVAGFGPIGVEGSVVFWRDQLGVPGLSEAAPGYFASDGLPGVKAFAVWPLEQAAETTFGTPTWPDRYPVPQAWLELDVATPAAVADAAEEMRGKGLTVIADAREEPWGQTTARLLSPEGLLVGISHTPWMHQK